jgi:hypothetical protein
MGRIYPPRCILIADVNETRALCRARARENFFITECDEKKERT